MKILVCMKQVPQKDAPLKLNDSGTWIREDVSYEVNEPDAFALEEALRQKEKHSGEVVAITAGPARASQVLREALAKGADRAIHLEDSAFVGLDAYNTARAIAAAIKDEKYYTVNVRARSGSDDILIYESDPYSDGYFCLRANKQFEKVPAQTLKAAGLPTK